MNIPYVSQIKAFITIALVVGSIWYVVSLRDTVALQKNTISELNSSIQLQNQATEAAAKARELLQARLYEAAMKNKKLSSENARLKGEIEVRPDSKTCEEAMNFVAATSKRVAEEWNSK